MLDPHQSKISFGLFKLSRRMYFTLWFLGMGAWIGIGLVGWKFVAPGSPWGRVIHREYPWFESVALWVFWGAIVVEILEAAVTLWRFRKREEFLRRERVAADGISVNNVGEF